MSTPGQGPGALERWQVGEEGPFQREGRQSREKPIVLLVYPGGATEEIRGSWGQEGRWVSRGGGLGAAEKHAGGEPSMGVKFRSGRWRGRGAEPGCHQGPGVATWARPLLRCPLGHFLAPALHLLECSFRSSPVAAACCIFFSSDKLFFFLCTPTSY